MVTVTKGEGPSNYVISESSFCSLKEVYSLHIIASCDEESVSVIFTPLMASRLLFNVYNEGLCSLDLTDR